MISSVEAWLFDTFYWKFFFGSDFFSNLRNFEFKQNFYLNNRFSKIGLAKPKIPFPGLIRFFKKRKNFGLEQVEQKYLQFIFAIIFLRPGGREDFWPHRLNYFHEVKRRFFIWQNPVPFWLFLMKKKWLQDLISGFLW